MEKATEIFEKHWTKATGKPLDKATKHHMKYAIEAINEALLLGAVVGRSEQLPPNPITDKEHKDLMKALYPKDNSKRFRR